jgi:hypothetical protein
MVSGKDVIMRDKEEGKGRGFRMTLQNQLALDFARYVSLLRA